MSDVVKTLPLILQVMPTEITARINGEICRLWQGVDEHEGQYLLWVRAVQPLDEIAERAVDMTLSQEGPLSVADIWQGDKPMGKDGSK